MMPTWMALYKGRDLYSPRVGVVTPPVLDRYPQLRGSPLDPATVTPLAIVQHPHFQIPV
jgi:hypothetical protein